LTPPAAETVFVRSTKIIGSLGPLVILLALSGCASTIQYPPFPDQTKRIEDPNKARIYLIRPPAVGGQGVAIRYYENTPEAIGPRIARSSRMVGELGPGSYLCWEAHPGERSIQTVEGETNSINSFKLQAGEVYFFKISIRPGWTTARNVIEPIDEAKGRSILRKCNPPADYMKGRNQ